MTTSRLILRPVDTVEAVRIRDRIPAGADRWADGYPFAGDIAAINGFLSASAELGEQQPFGYYQITRRQDGLAIGGIGFKGRPEQRSAEIGYGLIPGARGHGYAAEALLALMSIATAQGVALLRADTTVENIGSQRTLQNAGFNRIATDAELWHYEARLPPR